MLLGDIETSQISRCLYAVSYKIMHFGICLSFLWVIYFKQENKTLSETINIVNGYDRHLVRDFEKLIDLK